ncbi:uncharacterized protein LOC143593187 [Bidens hawaiensis]|uniref:uncharacterized protein LOC143593187 n=1 Tax=Bidens hawaiensis TaxID=980011 RepID=UPI004049280B
MLELIKDYDCEIKYYSGKANVVADALSRNNEKVITTVKSYKLIVNSYLFTEISKVKIEVLADEGKRGKLSPMYIGPIKIIGHVVEVAYKLDLPAELEGIHSTFHVSHLRKCLADDTSHVSLMDIEADEQLNYIEQLVKIVDRKDKQLHQNIIL